MRIGIHRWALAGLVACACSDPPPSQADVGEVVIDPRPREIDDSHQIYDGSGIPLPSDVIVAGLVLPRGLTAMTLSDPRRHAYSSIVPVDPLLRYFGPRLTTMQIDRHGDVVTYVDAEPRDAEGVVVPLTVSIAPSTSNDGIEAAIVRISERPPMPPPENPVTDEELREHFRTLNERRE